MGCAAAPAVLKYAAAFAGLEPDALELAEPEPLAEEAALPADDAAPAVGDAAPAVGDATPAVGEAAAAAEFPCP